MKPTSKAGIITVYERVVTVYDMKMPSGKIIRWDDAASAKRFAIVHHAKAVVRKMSPALAAKARQLENRTTPDAFAKKQAQRKRVNNEPHSVSN